MQDLLDAQIPAVVLIPLLIGCFALWRCSQWIGQSNEVRRTELIRLSRKAQEEQDRLERDHEHGYGSHQEYLRQRQGIRPRQMDDYRVIYRSQPFSGYDYPRQAQVEQDFRYSDNYDYLRREDEESTRRRRLAEEWRQAEEEEYRNKQAKELAWIKQAEVDKIRRKLAQDEEERRHRAAADADIRMRLSEETERRRIAAEEELRRIQAQEEERKKRQIAVDESIKRAEAEAEAKKMAEEDEIRKKKADEITQKGSQHDVGGHVEAKVRATSKSTCIVCQIPTKRRCAKCKGVFYCSRECQSQHWHGGHKFECRTLQACSSPASSEGGRRLSDLLSPRSTRSDMGSDETVASSFLPAISPTLAYEPPTISYSAPVSPSSRSLLKTSSTVSADGRRLKPKKALFSYDDFVELFDWDIKFIPCGLFNCGNSCFANAVLQCLTYTQPLVAYLLRGDHRRYCKNSGWCFMCSLEEHAVKVQQNRSPFSPVDIVSHVRNIGKGLSFGKQEDAHEFMSYAIHLLQSICLDEVGGEKTVDGSSQETTLIHHIFGGLLQSQVKCMECRHQSNIYEITMDLAVEIQGNVGSLEDALRQFTTPELLEGENKYKCDRCNTYVEARKQITIHEAPNILIVTLKRFKSGKFGKLNKRITFPEVLDMASYMSEDGDKPPLYSLYAIVVHVDVDESNAAYYGHYICLVKNPNGCWFRVDDSKVTQVDIYAVISQQAYMLLYKRSNCRPVNSSENNNHHHHHYQASSVTTQDGYVANSFSDNSQPQQFPSIYTHWHNPLEHTMHVPVGISTGYG